MINRYEKKRIPKLLEARKGRVCVRCGADDGTVVNAHYSGIRQHTFGKGRGEKAHDFMSASLCKYCHDFFDESKNNREKIEKSEEFLLCIALTHLIDIEEGVIKF